MSFRRLDIVKLGRVAAALFLAVGFLLPLDAAIVEQTAGAATCASASLTVTPLTSAIFYADYSPSPPSLPNLAGHYTGYRITNTSGAAVNGAWVKLSNFTGGVISLAPSQAAYEPLANMAPAGSGLSYFYLSASAATAAAQTHTISVYDRRPDLTGATELCNTTFTFTSVTNTTQAAANQVNVATATSNPPGLGATMTLTVSGDTGTIGAGSAADPGGFDMTPAAVVTGTSAWSPGAYRLLSAVLNINLTGGGATNHSDFLHYTITDPSSATRPYTITYTFVIVGTTSSNTAVTPIQYIASGTQIKHTNMSGTNYAAILPIQPISNTTNLAKSVSPVALTTPGGTATYTVTATNSSGSQGASLDDFTDTPGAGSTYVPGSSKFNGVTVGNPLTSGSTLVWVGPFAVPAGASRTLTYDVNIVSAIGTVTNSVIGHIGASVIDTTTSTGDNVPATSSVTVAAPPTLNLTKTVGSRVNASDQFTVAIMSGATTVAAGTTSGAGTTANTGVQTLASGTTYSLTDAMAGGSASTIGQYVGTISCSNTASGSTTVVPTGSTAPFSITPLAGDAISCSITNAPAPTLTLIKSVVGRTHSTDQFTVAVKNGATTVASATTSGTGTSATTGSTAASAGTTYSLTDVMAGGSSSAISSYASAVACTNSASGSTTTLPSGTGRSFSVTPAAGDAITCTITNTAPAPTLNLSTSVVSRADPADQFTAAIMNGAITVGSATTAGAGTTAATGAQALTAGTTYTLNHTMASGSVDAVTDYESSISCTNSNTGSATTLPSGSATSFSITPGPGDVISCTITKDAKPRITLIKHVVGRVTSTDQFTVAIKNGATTVDSTTTSGTGTSASTGSTVLSAATTYTLTDAMAGGSASSISAYLSSISCSNNNSGSTTILPSGSGTSFSVTPANGDTVNCQITNTAKPRLTLIKTVTSRANPADQFTVAIKNGATTVNSATTSGAGTSATTGIQTLASATTYTLSDTMASGSASALGQYAGSISCSNAASGSSTFLPSGAGTSFSVTPASGDLITCTITNTAGTATLGLVKTASPNTNVIVGNTITYTYAVTNTGTLPLTNVTVSDPHVGLSAITCTPAQGSTLAAAATMSCTATYTITQADVDGGSILNTGTVTGTDPSANIITKTAGTTVTAAQSASFSLSKSASPSTNVIAGDVVTYTFSGTNTGSVALHNVSVSDPMSGLSAVTCSPAAPTTLAPNATISCSATYTVTQSNVNAGSFANTATIGGLDPSNNPVSQTGSTTVTARQTATLALSKTASPNTGVVAGDVVTYTLHGQNTGSTSLHGVSVTDPMPGLSAITCTPTAPATLAPSAVLDCTATNTVTQADVDAGAITNTATIDGLDPSDNTVTQNAAATVTATQASALALTKTASPNSGVVAGDIVTFTMHGQNTGTVTLHDVSVIDWLPGVSALACSPLLPTVLAPGDTVDCTATYTVTQTEVDNGGLVNEAEISGFDPGNTLVRQPASATADALQVASLSLAKTASPSSGVVAGDVVTYMYTGENDGTVTIESVSITDPMSGLSSLNCTPAAGANLAPGATMTCTATYTVTQTDVDAGSIVNTAEIDGYTIAIMPVTDTAAATVTTATSSGLSFSKSASPASGEIAGDVVTYTFHGQNAGAVTLHNVSVTDPMSGLSALTCTPTAPATLAPSAVIDCTATYTVTQADVDASSINNTATVSGLDPSDNPVSQSASFTVTPAQSASISLTKTVSPSFGVIAGDVVTYTMTATNTGVTTLNTVTIIDGLAGMSALSCTPAIPGTLAPGDSMTCTGTYTVTQADVDSGGVVNIATVVGYDPSVNPATDDATAFVTADASADVTFTKTASPTSGVVAGDVVTYTFATTNTGPTTLSNVAVTDPMADLSPITCTPSAPATLAPGAGQSCTATYTVTQADVDAGAIVNTATVSVVPSQGSSFTRNDSATVTTDTSAGVSLAKNASPSSGVTVGDTITYTFHAVNIGAVTLNNLTVTDPMAGLSAITCTPVAPASLAPAAVTDCTASYTVTQADVDSGSIDNTATVAGTPPTGPVVTNTAGATVTTATTATVSLTKTASPTSGLFVGDTVTYTMTTTNTGAVSLHNVTITDPMVGLSALSCTPVNGSTLGSGATMTCTATYTVTQTDVDNGTITNTATVDSLDPSNNPVADSATKTVLAGQTASLSLVKSATPSSGVVAGDIVDYGFDVTNTGTVSLTNVNVADPMVGLSALTCTPAQGSTLVPGATMHCDADYTVTQADVDTGSIVNTATATGTDPVGNPATATDSATVTANQTQQIDLVKTASPDTGVSVGATVTYTMVATNNGAVTVDNVVITDPMAGLSALACTPNAGATLVPGATMTCTATYVATAADTARGFIDNTATVDGVAPGGHTVTHAATASVPTVTSAEVSLNKKLENVTDSVATWNIIVNNTGTTPYPGPVTVTDALPTGLGFQSATGAGWSCTGTQTVKCVHAADLPVGASSTVTVKTTITGEGAITNTATMDVAGTTLQSAADYTPGGGFAFTGSDAQRLGLLGLVGIVGGWFMVIAARKRDEDDVVTES